MKNVNSNVKYEIQKDSNGMWVINGSVTTPPPADQPDAEPTVQKFATVYALDQELMSIFVMLTGSGFCPPAQDDNDEGPLNLRLVTA